MRYIDADVIIRETDNGKHIFQHYFPQYDFGSRGAFLKLRPEEKTASAQIALYKGEWRITDFGNQSDVNSLNGIRFVMWHENYSWYEALKFIEEVILRRSVSSDNWKRPSLRAEYSYREMSADDKKGEYAFVYKEKSEITSTDLEAIGRYVTAETLEHFNCRLVKSYEYCSYSEKLKRDVVHQFAATEDYPIMVFDYGDFKKLYRPHDPEKKNRFIYIGNKPKNYIYGLKQLKAIRNEFVDEEGTLYPPTSKPSAVCRDLFRCSGESDALNLASLGFHVYWLNSESAELTYNEYREMDELCENHYQIMDLDKTGRVQAIKNALKYIELYTIELPQFLNAKRDFRGNPCKDLKDFINLIGDDQDDTTREFRALMPKACRIKFWYETDKGVLNFSMTNYHFFLKANGFAQIEYSHLKNSDYCYVHIEGKQVRMIAPDELRRIAKKFTLEWIRRKKLPNERQICDKLITSNQITESNMDMISSVELDFRNASAGCEYLHFMNSSLRITPDEIRKVRHDEVPNHILGSVKIKGKEISHIIKNTISSPSDKPAIEVTHSAEYSALLKRLNEAKSADEKTQIAAELTLLSDIDKYEVKINDRKFIFAEFLHDLSRIYWQKELEAGEELTERERKEENLALANIMFCIGYLAAQYKNQAKPWIVFLQDMKISEVGKSSGRSGKSLVSKALTFVRQSFYVEGRRLTDTGAFQFLYDGLTEFHDIIEVDDFAEYGDFSYFYTQTTGQRTVNSKHTSPFVLDYEDSGKMIISSNFELPNTDSSTMARLLNCGVSDYYHEQSQFNDYLESRSPYTKFGRQLYSDFTDDEWQKFYYFIAYCIQLVMRFDKIQPPMSNIEKRQLRRQMSDGLGREENFLKWADDYFRVWNTADGPRPERTPEDSECAYLDTLFSRGAALNNFLDTSGISDQRRKNYNAQRFKIQVEAWAKYRDFEFNPVELCNSSKDRRIIKSKDNKSVEYFYLRTTMAATLPSSKPNTEPTENMPF